MAKAGQDHDSPRVIITTSVLAGLCGLVGLCGLFSGTLDHEWEEEVGEEEVSEVVGGHVELQTLLCQVLLGQGHARVQDQNVKPGEMRI